MLKIGLTQRVEILVERDERRDCLDQAWTALLVPDGCWPVPLPNTVRDVSGMIRDLNLDGVILTGGNDLTHVPGARNTAPHRDDFERELLTCCRRQQIPVLGVCRGLQMMVDYYGGQLVPVVGHVATRHPLVVRSPTPMPLTDRDEVNSFHDFGVKDHHLGPELQVVATAPDGSVEAIAHRTLPQWAVMWHPERAPRDERDHRLIQTLFVKGIS